MTERAPLEREIRRRIETAGPMPVAEYMALCLFDREHGYYMTRDPLGARGDFITAPEVSQMFGELIGLWAAAVWKQMGAPENVRLIELGPGRGTMLRDALRAVQIVPEFHAAIVAHLVEVSPVLQALQEKTLEGCGVTVFWHPRLSDVPKGPAILLANEFFDALPVNQAIKTERGWHERRIQIDADGQLAFTIAPEPLPFFQTLLPPHFDAARAGALRRARRRAWPMPSPRLRPSRTMRRLRWPPDRRWAGRSPRASGESPPSGASRRWGSESAWNRLPVLRGSANARGPPRASHSCPSRRA